MASRRSNPRESDRVRTRTGSANAERIRSRNVSEPLTEVLREETRLPRISTQEAKDLQGEKSVARVKSLKSTLIDFVISVTAPRYPGLLRDLRDLDSFAFELDCLLWASVPLGP
ncbi:hypothetical protein F2Q68_00026314 [Brassica cretica]|uniref:Uncharacterized protein n=1 Tax=Brassica cretica TaxID=69181 RepID=A0A8S9IET2_BRACR|nr:hypothetical protein F2Q68_00026314 [Brassica cretica]